MTTGELEHYKKLYDIHRESIERSDKHTQKMTGLLLSAVLNPDSVINRDQRAILKDKTQDGEGCGPDCHYKEPYGFVHEADCPNG